MYTLNHAALNVFMTRLLALPVHRTGRRYKAEPAIDYAAVAGRSCRSGEGNWIFIDLLRVSYICMCVNMYVYVCMYMCT